ncbi:MAG: phosphatase PAP2 family protein [Hyphomicrobiales bacterium]|nr:phosphatase PAP2 family protein [Hyphomicrobiales bacterium]
MYREADTGKFAIVAMVLSALASIAAAVVFLTNPGIDLLIQRHFYSQETGFILNFYPSVGYLRSLAIYAYALWYTTVIFGLVSSIFNVDWRVSNYFGFGMKQWLYLTTTSLIGPLLIVNIILKNNWGRARPRQLLEFGGNQEFSPPLLLSDQCQTNCSFVSGEPSSMFMIFISLAFVLPAKRYLLIILMIVMGTLSGIMRMGQGGHFLSDVIFAGLFMVLSAAIIYWMMFNTKRS